MANKVSFIIELKDSFSRVAKQVNSQFSTMQSEVKKTSQSFSRFASKSKASLKSIGKQATITGGLISASVTAPFVLLTRTMVKSASTAVETANKFDNVFEDVREKANQVADEFSSSFGTAGSTARKLIGDTGDLLVGFGFTGDAALDLSKRVNELAADLTSFQNVQGGVQAASKAITSGLVGQTESLKSLGIVVRQNTKEFRQQTKILMRTRGVTELQAKSIQILDEVAKQSRKAVGDAARTWDDYESVVRRSEEATIDLNEEFGKVLIPIATKVTKFVTGIVKSLKGLSPETKKFILILAGLVAIAGPLLIFFGAFALAISAITLPLLLVGVAIVGLIAIGALLIANWEKVKSEGKAIWEGISDFIDSVLTSIGEGFVSLFEGRLIDAMGNWANAAIKLINKVLTPLNWVSEKLGLGSNSLQIPEFSVKIDESVVKRLEANSAPISNVSSGTLSGTISVVASPGTQVKESSLSSESSGMNLGINMVTSNG